jgi:hypothetical protein
MNFKIRFLKLSFLLALFAYFGGVNCLLAQTTRTWTGGAGNNTWSDNSNWDTQAPSPGDDVVLPNNTSLPLEIPGGSSFRNLTLNGTFSTIDIGNGGLTLTGNLTIDAGVLHSVGESLSVDGTTDIGASGLINSTGGNKIFTGLVTNNGSLLLTGADATMGNGLTHGAGATVTVVGTSLAITGNLQVSNGEIATSASDFSVSLTTTISAGASITSSGGDKTFSGLVTNNGVLNLTGTTEATMGNGLTHGVDATVTGVGTSLEITGDVNMSDGVIVAGTGDLTVDGNIDLDGDAVISTGSGTFSVSGTCDIEAGAELVSDGGSKTFTGAVTNNGIFAFSGANTLGADLSVTGDLDISLGTLACGNNDLSASSGTTTISGTGSITSSDGTLIFDDFTNGNTFTKTGGSVTFNGAVDNNGGTISVNGTSVTFAGTIANPGTLTTNSFTALSVTGNVTATLSPTNLASLTINNAGANITLGADLETAGNVLVTTGTLTTAGQSFTVNGTTNLNSGGSITSNGGALDLSTGVAFADGSSILNISGGTADVVTSSSNISGLSTVSGVNLTLNHSGAVTYSAGQVSQVGNLTLGNGTSLTLGGDLFVSGNMLINNSGSLVTNARSVVFTGTVTNNGTLNISNSDIEFCDDYSGGTLTTNASSDISLTTPNPGTVAIPSAGGTRTIGSIELDDGGPTVNKSVSFSGTNPLVITTLTLTNAGAGSTITLGSRTVTITNAFSGRNNVTVNASGSSVVFGNTANFTNGGFNTSTSTNLTFGNTVTEYPTTASSINNLILTGSGNLDLQTDDNNIDLTINGVFTIGNGCTFTSEANQDITVYNAYTNNGTFVATDETNLTLRSTMLGTPSGYTTPENLNLFLINTGAVTLTTLPVVYKSITVNKTDASTINLSADIEVGDDTDVTNDLIITRGYIEIGNYDITLSAPDDNLSETFPYRIISSGTGYVTTATAGSNPAQIDDSNIGAYDIVGPAGGVIVRRYPKDITFVWNELSVENYYQIFTGTQITDVSIAYPTAGLNGNSASDLRIFVASDDAFTTNLQLGTPGDATSPAPTNGGIINIEGGFDGTDGLYYTLGAIDETTTISARQDGDWNNPLTWNIPIEPTIETSVVIPDEMDIAIPVGYVASANNITINGNGTLTMEEPNASLSVAGDFTVNSTASPAVLTGVTGGPITIDIDGNLSNTSSGTLNFASGTVDGDYVNLTIGGTFTNTGTGSINTNGAGGQTGAPANYGTNLTLDGTVDVILPEDITLLHSYTVDKTVGTVYQSNDLTVDGNTTTIYSGTHVVGDFDFTEYGSTQIDPGAVFNADSDEEATRQFGDNAAVDAVTLDGTAILTSKGPYLTNTFISAVTLANTTVGTFVDLRFSDVEFGGAISAGASSTLDIDGADVSITGTDDINFTDIIVRTNDNTSLDFGTNGGAVTLVAIDELLDLTVSAAPSAQFDLVSDLKVYGDLTIDEDGIDINGNKLTVYGTTDLSGGGGGTLNATASELILNGPANFTSGTFTTNLATELTFGVRGDITNFPPAVITVNKLTYSRTGVNTTLTTNAITFAGTNPVLNVTAGTITFGAADNLLDDDVNTVTTIGKNGTIDFDAQNNLFQGTVTGTGTLDATGVTSTGLTFSGVYSFTGDLLTASTTELIFDTGGGDVDLNSSVTDLNLLTYDRAGTTLTLNNDLIISTAISSGEFVDGTLDLNGNSLTFGGDFDQAANFTIDATDSKLVFEGTSDFTTGTFTIDETTDLEFQDTPTLVASITECKNLTIVGATAFVLVANADFEVWGNLDIQDAGGSVNLLTNTQDLTVRGDISNLGEINATGQTLTVYGSIQGEGTYTTTNTTNLVVNGTGSQLVLPYSFGEGTLPSTFAIGNITLNRSRGMKLNNNLTIGAAATEGLTITEGDLDLNGYVIALGAADASISETAGNTIINTGASGDANGFITTLTTLTTQGNIETSGIGVTTLTGGGNILVRRYPITVPVPGVGLSTSRIYYIENSAVITALTFEFDNTELYSSATDLEVYMSASESFASFTNISDETNVTTTVSENTPSSGFGRVALTGAGVVATVTASTRYYALAAEPGDGGVMYTYAGADDGLWSNSSNWSPTGVPTKIDQVVIGPKTVVLNGNGIIYECETLHLNHANATLKPYDNYPNDGNEVSLRVNGNITIAAGAEILGVNGNGRLNLIIGDGTSAGISSAISVNNDYVPTSGIWVNDFTVNAAEVPIFSNRIRVSGDISLLANSDVKLDNLELWGGYDNNQTITVPISANLELGEVTLDNDAVVTTESNITMTDKFIVKDGSSFEANNGLFTFNSPVANDGDPWIVEVGGTLKFWNVEFNSSVGTHDFSPIGIATVKGNFSQLGTDDFIPNSGRVIFENTSQKEIINTSNNDDLVFYNLEIAGGSNLVTSNDWQISGDVDVKANASLIAENGEIELTGTSKEIMNASNQTLFFNDVTVSGTYTTEDSWKVGGNMTITGTLEATDGTITFENVQEKTIDNGGGTLEFFKLLIADGSKVTTGSNFTIANNSINPTGAGIEVEGTGEYYVDDISSTITFDAGVGVSSGYPKTITKSTDGKLEFGNITIASSPNNEVTTASDFTITGTGGSNFNNAGAGGKFTATGGEITFDGAAPVIISVSPAVTQFYSIKTIDNCTLTMTDDQEIYIAGNITVNNQSNFDPAAAGDDAKLIFNGTFTQTLSGNTTVFNPVELADVQINKTAGTELVLDIDTRINSDAAHELTLTEGILNLGDQTFTVGAGIISRHTGVINGATGTYIINTSHVASKLEDTYFTVNGTPTLYNLQVDANHTTANDLTVNGELDLNTADLTIGSGADASAPVKLILNGDMTRSAGAINGDNDDSRLVLQGTGKVDGGLTNTYFTGSSNTTVQLEIARQESLGGNLTIGDGSSGYLRINSGINNLDLGTNILTFSDGALITMLSGGIEAGTGSTVEFNTQISTIPATMFVNNEAYNVTLDNEDYILGGDLTIKGTLSQSNSKLIYTKENVLTFGPNATLPTFSGTKHIIGTMRRTVDDDATVFNLGTGAATSYYPVTLEFATAGSEQLVTVSIAESDPTVDRGGNSDNAVDLTYNISTEGTTPADSLKAIFQWPTELDGGTTPTTDASFPARWDNSYWVDYRDDLESFTSSANPRVLTTDEYVIEAEDLGGVWAVFNADDDTDADKDDAIDVSKNKIVITAINPEKPIVNNATKITVELQNQFGQQVTAREAFEFTISKTDIFDGNFNSGATFDGVIPAGQSGITVSGLTFNAAGAENQLKIDTTGGSVHWTPTTTDLFPILQSMPATQASSIDFSNVENTSMTIDWTDPNNAAPEYTIIIMKADSLLTEDEYPVNGTSYFANTIYGAGSSIGDAVVVYNDEPGTGTGSVDVTGLAPNTTYYVYAFVYRGADGNERYRTSATSGNPNLQATSGSYDDDETFGTNNTRATSKTIGTNTPVYGTIKSSTDEDWFNFTVTSSSPNIRGTLELASGLGNYNIELYNEDNRRIRRGIRISNNDEAQVINDLPAGTYTVRIYGVDGAYNAVTPYVLKVKTNADEIFSVTE